MAAKKLWGIRTKLVVSLTLMNMICVALFAGLSYRSAQSQSLTDIDDILCAAAAGGERSVSGIVATEAERP
ncbi:MAG: hypothetical protein FJX59_18185 [Alphaproteobacteria bacterium]|nr:hypothetical protein [Alphaproteobacteria bacterium]